MSFYQQPPQLTSTYRSDVALREQLQRLLPDEVREEVEPQLEEMGELAAGPVLELGRAVEADPPRLVQYDPWGQRVDRVQLSPAWQQLHAIQARAGLCSIPYEGAYEAYDRLVHHALYHLYAPSSNVYTCPMAMSDGATRIISDHATGPMRQRVLSRLLSRDPEASWTSGQWMTERPGGSDVGRSETAAIQEGPEEWRLWGAKWFCSSITSQCALALARPQGASAGSSGLALFLVELEDPREERQLGRTILIDRLKDKLGTRAVPTAELTLQGALATPVGEPDGGLRKMAGMLNVCRLHNAISAAAVMRRAVDRTLAYAQLREAFGSPLIDLPLHRETLADLAVESEAALALALRASELMGRVDHEQASEQEQRMLRVLIPVLKLLTGKDAVACVTEAIECFGGAGYVEDTGLPLMLRNAHILPIWEGTTNVLSLDLLRAAQREDTLGALLEDITARLADAQTIDELSEPLALIEHDQRLLAERAAAWIDCDPDAVQSSMRSYAMRLGRCYAASLLVEHAAHRWREHRDRRASLVARRHAGRWLTMPFPDLANDDARHVQSLEILTAEDATARAPA